MSGNSVDKLIPLLKHRDVFKRQEAAEALGEIGDPAAVEPLISALEDKDTMVIFSASEALVKIAEASDMVVKIAKLAIDHLLQKLKEQVKLVRKAPSDDNEVRKAQHLIRALDKISGGFVKVGTRPWASDLSVKFAGLEAFLHQDEWNILETQLNMIDTGKIK